MRISIVGAGNGGTTVGADLALKGHEVTLLKTSNKIHNKNYDFIIKNNYEVAIDRNNNVQKAKLSLVTTDFKAALQDAELIILYVQTNFQEEVIKKMAPYLSNQIILIEPGYLATLYFLKYCNCQKLTFAEAQSSPLDCRIIEPGKVKVLFENVRNPIGIYPKEREDRAFKVLGLLGYNFVKNKNIVEAALHNPNLIVHTIGAFMSIPRIEYTHGKNYWMYKEVFTPSVWNLVNGLDKEKIKIMKALGCDPVSYPEACKYRNSNDDRGAEEVFFDYANNHSASGPEKSDSRYITEDVPEGLVLMESLGEMLDINTPICTSIIKLSSCCLNRQFRDEGRSIEKIGKDNFKKILRNIN
ncbi:NAD/NADP octopine/nopaline dehydrogenase family protein [Clostridium uliginosum]|uniref:Opine dehydrogenase n=1 Tax=Clostridium uliginosum TaxID=119641 RepID=A0A1I1JQ86_9CLOT|nr:NAD/NADP octopine/nopaline dehydrogenase family protein [Clostridium uliginosum]SFC48033.1 opine dehydrogenase [Clostridium uliginosum]